MSQPNIVIVEDDAWLAEHYSRVLEQEGYHPTAVTHAAAAIDEIDALQPVAIILDVLLTGSTAMVLLHELQSYRDTALIPVILCTNMGSDLQLDDFKDYGVQKILDKSTMLPEDLVAAIRSVTL
jgi:DNA-binding response OmpR family regulator